MQFKCRANRLAGKTLNAEAGRARTRIRWRVGNVSNSVLARAGPYDRRRFTFVICPTIVADVTRVPLQLMIVAAPVALLFPKWNTHNGFASVSINRRENEFAARLDLELAVRQGFVGHNCRVARR